MTYSDIWIFTIGEPDTYLREEIERYKTVNPFAKIHIVKFRDDVVERVEQYLQEPIELVRVPPQFRPAISVMRKFGVKQLPAIVAVAPGGYFTVLCQGDRNLNECFRQVYGRRYSRYLTW